MAEDRIDSIIDLKSIGNEFTEVNAKLTDLLGVMKSFPKVSSILDASNAKEVTVANNAVGASLDQLVAKKAKLTEAIVAQNKVIKDADLQNKATIASNSQQASSLQQNIKALNDYKKALNDAKGDEKEALELKKLNVIKEEEFQKRIIASTEAQYKYKQAISDVTKEIKDQTQLNLSPPTSIKEAQVQNRQLTTQRNALPVSDVAGIAALNAAIDKNNQLIDANSDKLAKQKINIGNYVGAVSILKDSLADVAQKIEQFNKAGQGNSDAAKAAQKEYTLLNKLVNSSAAGYTNAMQEIKANQKALLEMQEAGLRGTEAFKTLSLATGKLQDSLHDLKATTKNLGSDTFVFDGLLNAAQGLAGAYGVAQGAAALFGAENEELQKTFVKLQAIMTVIQGLQALKNSLQKENSAMLLFQIVREKVLLGVQTLKNFVLKGNIKATQESTASTGINTVAIEGQTVAATASAVALKVLRIALISTGIGAILVLLTSAALAMSSFSTETRVAAESLDDFNKRLEDQNKLLNDMLDDIDFAAKKRELQLKILGKTQGEIDANTLDGIKKQKDATTGLFNGQLSELNKLKEQRRLDNTEIERLNKKSLPGSGFSDKERFDANSKKLVLKSKLDSEEDYNKKVQALDKSTTDLTNQNRKLDQQYQLTDLQIKESNANKVRDANKKGADDGEKRQKDYNDREMKAQIELTKMSIEQRRDANKKIADDQNKTLEERLDALKKFSDAEADLNAYALTVGLQQAKSPNERKLVEKKVAQETARILEDLSTQTMEIERQNIEKINKEREDALEKMKAAAEEAYQFIKKQQEIAFQNEKDNVDITASKKILDLQQKFRDGSIKSIEDYNDKKTEIEKNATLEQTKLDLKQLESAKALFDVLYGKFGFKNIALEKQIQDATLKIKEDGFDKEVELAEKKKKLNKDLQDQLIKTGTDLVESGFNAQKAKNDAELAAIDEKSKKEIDAINASGLAQSEKEKRIMAIQKQADFNKQAIEKRQRKADLERAKFERAMSIFQIVAATRVAAMASLKAIPLAFGGLFPFLATLAIGAAQVASVLAQPLPKFAKGTKNAPKGFAVVGEEGSELIQDRRGNMFVTPGRPTLVDLAGGEKIFKHDVTKDMLSHMSLTSILQKVTNAKNVQKLDGYSEKIYKELRTLNSKPPFVIKVQDGMETSDYYKRNIKN